MAKPSLPQFERDYDSYKMRQLVDELNRWVETVESGESGAGGGSPVTGVHNDLSGLGAPNAHPISSISSLQSLLDAKANQAALDALEVTVDGNSFNIAALDIRVTDNEAELVDHETRITILESETVATLAQRVDDTTSSTIFYFGEALPGQLNSNATWRIQRITFITPGEDDVEIEWADGNSNFDNVWNNRLALVYS